MLLMVEKGIRGGICHVMHGYEKANSRYMKNYNKDEEFIDIDKGYILEVDVEYPKHLQFSYLGNTSHYDLQFLPEKIKINQIEKLVCNLYDKKTILLI